MRIKSRLMKIDITVSLYRKTLNDISVIF